jgi:DNA ligase 1
MSDGEHTYHVNFPTLYQKTQTGAIQRWEIRVDHEEGASLIVTTYGQVDGKLQSTSDTIWKGKNEGRANATTPAAQAKKEAKARWTKQLKKGYVEDIEKARAGEVDTSVIQGGIPPMLAPNKSYPKDPDLEKAIKFPCYFQPKLDGMRCIATIDDGKVSLWTRTRKPIRTVPHIVEALEKAFTGHHHIILDGELYNHDYRDRFEDLMSILRKDGPDPEGEYLNAQFHVYDCPEYQPDPLPEKGFEMFGNMNSTFDFRNVCVELCFTSITTDMPIKRVITTRAYSMDELRALYELALVDGYEGGMARNKDGKYESDRRSKNLQKMKEFMDAEFPVVGINDGRGKDAGTAATIEVRLPDGRTVPVRLKKPYAYRRQLFEHHEMWKNKILTVTFKRYTADGLLYIPTAKDFRDYE